jgi:hypothetical protein
MYVSIGQVLQPAEVHVKQLEEHLIHDPKLT